MIKLTQLDAQQPSQITSSVRKLGALACMFVNDYVYLHINHTKLSIISFQIYIFVQFQKCNYSIWILKTRPPPSLSEGVPE